MEYVHTQERLAVAADRLADVALIGADTEAAGYHRYFDRICLLQLSTRSETFLLDTLALNDLTTVGSHLADPGVEVVFHDADYDLRLLDRDFGIAVRGLFDTKIAAQFLGEPAIGLAALLESYLGVRLEKKHQRADWAKRPLPAQMLEYAAQDTRHLPALRDRLRDRLEAAARLAWAEEEFRLRESARWTAPAQDSDGYLRLKGTRDLRPRQLAALRELYAWREALAQRRDRAPFRVLSNEALVELARVMPRNQARLVQIPGISRRVADRSGDALLAALERVRALPEAELPRRPRAPGRPPPDPAFETTLERLKMARDRTAEALDLDRGFLMPKSQLEELVRRQPHSSAELAAIPDVRRWQVEAAGNELLAALRD